MEELRRRLALYVEKFRQVEGGMLRSNDQMTSFRKEVEIMTERLNKLQAENKELNSKKVEMAGVIGDLQRRQSKDADTISQLDAQVERLKQLCRAIHQRGQGNSPS